MNAGRERIRGLLSRLRTALRERGAIHVLRSLVKESYSRLDGFIGYWYHRTFRSGEVFRLDGETYRYFYHVYGKTWKNERAVEVTVVWEVVKACRGKRILEIGNVLPNYFSLPHVVVDKYEVADGVINCDVVDFKSSERYDLIVSISTMEHVGWEENPREPEKVLRAFENLRSLLAPGGKILVTMPLGLNAALDGYVREGVLRFDKMLFMRKMLSGNTWEEARLDDLRDVQYDHSNRRANALIIGFIEGDTAPADGS